jgi:hypothetical protein
MFKLIVFISFIVSCGPKHEEKDPQPLSLKDLLIAENDKLIEQAKEAKDADTSWILAEDCDSMLWNGKMSCNDKVTWFNPRLAEYPDQVGRYTRRPISKGYCYPKEEGKDGSACTWSRDMGHGLGAYAICKKDLDIVKEHIRFGENHSTAGIWDMGEPFADGRALYPPGFSGMWYQMRYALGGDDNVLRKSPDIYISGLDDYQAHLQVLNIWNRMRTGEKIGDNSTIPQKPVDGEVVTLKSELKLRDGTLLEQGDCVKLTDDSYRMAEIRESMYQRLKEHAGREPECPFYTAMFHHFEDGNYESAARSILNGGNVKCTYVRCNDKPGCHIAEKLFVIQQILNWVK